MDVTRDKGDREKDWSDLVKEMCIWFASNKQFCCCEWQ